MMASRLEILGRLKALVERAEASTDPADAARCRGS
jgi:hypothetical protein